MDDRVRLPWLELADDCSFARLGGGSDIAFTRAERLLLQDLTGNHGRLRARNHLLDAMTEPGSDAVDRNVDFHINRLRTKLGDSARNPRFIQTVYGVVFVWVGPRPRPMQDLPGAFIRVGPLTGMGMEIDGACHAFASAIADALRGGLAADRKVELEPDEAHARPGQNPRFLLELRFLRTNNGTDCISVLRAQDHPVLLARRDNAIAVPEADTLAAAHLEALWRALGDWEGREGPDAAPIDVRIAHAGEALAPVAQSEEWPQELAALKDPDIGLISPWLNNEARLRRLIEGGKATAAERLMLAVSIQSRYIMDGWRFLAHGDPREVDDGEIHDLVLPVLPELLADPQYALSAARVLTVLGPGYRQLGLDIAEDAFRQTTALGHALPIVGSLRCLSGQFDSGLDLLHQARALCKPGSVAERFVLSLICQNLLASGAFAAKDRMVEQLARSPLSKGPFRLVYATPGEMEPSLAVRLHLKISPRRYARSTLLWSYWIGARLYSQQEARENVIVGLAGLLARQYGPDVIPPEVAAAIPAVLGGHREASLSRHSADAELDRGARSQR